MSDLHDIDQGVPVLDPATLPAFGPQTTAEVKAARRLARRVARQRFIRMTEHGAAVDHLRPLPEPGEIVYGVCDGRYSNWCLVTAAIELLGQPVDELVISTLGYSRPNLESLVELLDAGTVRSVLMNVSNYFRHSDIAIYADLRRELTSRGHTIGVTRSHAKLCMLAAGERRIVIQGSGNLRSSHNFEQWAISDDPELYSFHREWIADLIASSQEAT